jgi:hypothetical protein
MTTRGIPAGELPLEVRAKLPELGPDSPLRRDVDDQVERSQRGRRRQRAGAGFEAELQAVHELYWRQRRARLRRGTPEMVRIATHDRGFPLFTPRKGGTTPDFLGAVKVRGASLPAELEVKSWDRVTYAHDPKRYGQLRSLLECREMGGLGLLLIRAAELHLVYVVSDRGALQHLAAGAEVKLRDPIFGGRGSGRRQANDPDAFTHHFPVIREPTDLLISQSVPRWDWLSLLEA